MQVLRGIGETIASRSIPKVTMLRNPISIKFPWLITLIFWFHCLRLNMCLLSYMQIKTVSAICLTEAWLERCPEMASKGLDILYILMGYCHLHIPSVIWQVKERVRKTCCIPWLVNVLKLVVFFFYLYIYWWVIYLFFICTLLQLFDKWRKECAKLVAFLDL